LILGPDKVMRSLLGTFFFPVAIELTAPFLPAATQDPLLASVYGGIVMGLGLGLVLSLAMALPEGPPCSP